MSDDEFFNNIETIIANSRTRIAEKEKLIYPAIYDEGSARDTTDRLDIQRKKDATDNSLHNSYKRLVVHPENVYDKDSSINETFDDVMNLSDGEEIKLVKKKLKEYCIKRKEEEKALEKKRNKETKKTTYNPEEIQKYESTRNKKKQKNKNTIINKSTITNKSTNTNKITIKNKRDDIKEFINLEKELILTKTLVHNKKKEIDDIYNYINKKDQVLKNLNKTLIANSEKFQESLMQNFKKTEETIKKLEEVTNTKKIKKSQVQSLKMEISKLEMELEKKEEQISELKKYKFILLKLSESEKKEKENKTEGTHETQEKQETQEQVQKRDEKENEQNNEKKKQESKSENVEAEIKIETQDITENQKNEEELFLKKITKYVNNSQLLIDSFHSVEEEYLQLIDDSQNTEYELNRVQKKYEDKKRAAEIKKKEIQKKIKDVENIIKEYYEKIKEYETVFKENPDNFSFTNISSKIDFIFNQFDYDINTDDIMKKLQILENKIYLYITTLTKYTEEDASYVYEIQRECEHERRKQMRFEVNLDRNKGKQAKELDKSKKGTTNKKNLNTKKKEKREDIYTKFENDLFNE